MANSYSDKHKRRMPAAGDLGWDDEVNQNQLINDIMGGARDLGNVTVWGLAASDGGGLQVDYAAGRVEVGGLFFDITAGNKTALDDATDRSVNYLYVDNAGAVQISQTAPTGNYVPIAMVDVSAADIDRIGDFRGLNDKSTTLGGSAETELTISSGVIVPSTGTHSVDTEGDIGTDDLSNLTTTNMKDGSILHVRAESAVARNVVVKHLAGGAGQIHLVDAVDLTLDEAGKFVVLQRRGADWYEMFNGPSAGGAAGASLSVAEGIKTYCRPTLDTIFKMWESYGFNQQWGGDNLSFEVDGVLYPFHTAAINWDGAPNLGSSAALSYRSTSVNIKSAISVDKICLFMHKTGNPTDNLLISIYTDSAGSPGSLVTNGNATAIPGKVVDTEEGSVVIADFPTPPSLTAGNYHIVATRSGSIDGSNYYFISRLSGSNYPDSIVNLGDATPTWSQTAGQHLSFAIIPTDATAGITDGVLRSTHSSKFKLSHYFNHEQDFSIPILCNIDAGEKDKTLFDVGVSTDSSRIRVSTESNSYAQVDLWNAAGTKSTVTGTADITGSDIIIWLKGRCVGDGSDYLRLYVGETEQGTPLTSQTFTMDSSFQDQHISILGGWPLPPTWTVDAIDTSVLPSNANNGSWTWTGTATEANAFVAEGGYWFQNGAGYASTESGQYAKVTSFVNATGWFVETKLQILYDVNIVNELGIRINILDDTKRLLISLHEYYLEVYDGTNWLFAQYDFKSKPVDLKIEGKGSDFKILADNKLLFDGTGLLLDTTPGTSVFFGDSDATADSNASVRWYYMKAYAGEVTSDELTASELHEIATIERDVGTDVISNVYNSGTLIPLKQYFGLHGDFLSVDSLAWSIEKVGIESSPSTTNTIFEEIPEMDSFTYGKVNGSELNLSVRNSVAAGQVTGVVSINSTSADERARRFESTAANDFGNIISGTSKKLAGLNYISGQWNVSASTGLSDTNRRSLTVKGE